MILVVHNMYPRQLVVKRINMDANSVVETPCETSSAALVSVIGRVAWASADRGEAWTDIWSEMRMKPRLLVQLDSLGAQLRRASKWPWRQGKFVLVHLSGFNALATNVDHAVWLELNAINATFFLANITNKQGSKFMVLVVDGCSTVVVDLQERTFALDKLELWQVPQDSALTTNTSRKKLGTSDNGSFKILVKCLNANGKQSNHTNNEERPQPAALVR